MITKPDKSGTDARTYKIVKGESLEDIYVRTDFYVDNGKF